MTQSLTFLINTRFSFVRLFCGTPLRLSRILGEGRRKCGNSALSDRKQGRQGVLRLNVGQPPIPSRARISVSCVADSPVRVPATLLAEWAAPRTRRWQNWSTQDDYLRV